MSVVTANPIADRAVTADTLSGITLFTTLAPTLREHIALQMRGQIYPLGSTILAYQSSSSDVYFLVSGVVRVSYRTAGDKEITFRDQGPGEAFGLLSALDDAPRSASVQALQECFVLVLSQTDFKALIKQHPDFAETVLRQLSGLVRSLSARVVEYSALHVANRIRTELLRLAQPVPGAPQRGIISPAPTHAELASRVSTHREAVTRQLNALVRANLIKREARTIVTPDMARLRALCAQDLGL